MLKESVTVIAGDAIRATIEQLMGAVQVRDGLIWVDVSALPAATPPEAVLPLMEEINRILLETNDRITSVNDLARVLEVYGGGRVEIPDTGPPARFHSPLMPQLQQFNPTTPELASVTVSPMTVAPEILSVSVTATNAGGGDVLQQQIFNIWCDMDLAPPVLVGSWVRASMGGECWQTAGPNQILVFNHWLYAQLRVEINFVQYWMYVGSRRHQRVIQTGETATWNINTTHAYTYCLLSGVYRSKFRLSGYGSVGGPMIFPVSVENNPEGGLGIACR